MAKNEKVIPLKLIIGTVSDEKGVSEELIVEAVEAALVSATKRKHGADIDVRVDIDRKTGAYTTHRMWTVVEDPETNQPLENPYREITLSAARVDSPEIQLGEKIEEEMESVEFGRIAVQSAKQVILQKVREAERNKVAKEYLERVGSILVGVVKKATRDNIIVDIGNNAEGIIKRECVLPRESYRMGDKIRAYLESVGEEAKGPQLLLSRTCKEMIYELFKKEVPEVEEGIIEIKSISRDPGIRAKIAVKTNDGRLDPVGACVGMRGARVQAVSNELSGERVDIILWDDDPAQFVMNAMAPAEIVSIVVDEDTKTMDLAVSEESLSQAIGRNGQNVKLASDLTGWSLNVMSDEEAATKSDDEAKKMIEDFVKYLNVDEEVAEVLVSAGFSTIEEVAYVPVKELLDIDVFDEEIVESLRAAAKDALVLKAIADKEVEEKQVPSEDLLSVDGVDQKLATVLVKNSIANRDDLAELSIEELTNLVSDMTDEEAGKIIMAARAHWFAAE